jgi:hypothetical protein
MRAVVAWGPPADRPDDAGGVGITQAMNAAALKNQTSAQDATA